MTGICRFLVLVGLVVSLSSCGSSSPSESPSDLSNEANAVDAADDSGARADSKEDVAQEVDAPATEHLWSTCEEYSEGPGTLAAKAEYLDQLVADQHLLDGLLRSVILGEDGEVTRLLHVPSTGLWTAMYLASQGYRFAVTGSSKALVNGEKAATGLHDLTGVTGVSGLYGRAYQRPEAEFEYGGTPNPDWGWAESTAPGYEGWWLNYTVSKDTMDGIMFGYATALDLFGDAPFLDIVRQDVTAFIDHLISNGLQIIDIDGKVTEHGRMYYSAMDDFPGFNAILTSSWIRVGLDVNPNPEWEHFYYDCLMRKGDTSDCPDIELADLGSYMDAMEKFLSLYMHDCQTSYDHFDMVFQAVDPLYKRETAPNLHARLGNLLDNGIWKAPEPNADPALSQSTHSLYIFMYAGMREREPGDAVVDQAIHDAVCTLRRMPADRHDRTITPGTQEEVCKNRMGDPNAGEVIPIEERYYDNYVWRLDPYEIPKAHAGTPGLVHSPEDWLLAYWMGRYYGFITPEM